MSDIEGLNLDKLPYNFDNFNRLIDEVNVLRDIVLKQNAVIATKPAEKPAPKTTKAKSKAK